MPHGHWLRIGFSASIAWFTVERHQTCLKRVRNRECLEDVSDVAKDPYFRTGNFDTGFMERFLAS